MAAKDSQPGEQLTCDYGTLVDNQEFECIPEKGTSRTKVTANDYLAYYKEWDEIARETFKFFYAVSSH